MTDHVTPDRQMHAALITKGTRFNVWRTIHHACEWKTQDYDVGTYCIKMWGSTGMLVECQPTRCPLIDETLKRRRK